MERHFDEELDQLKNQILRMGVMAQGAIERAVGALGKRDRAVAQEVIDQDKAVDELENRVDQMCLDLLVRRQPMAIDLRFVAMAMKISTDIERIADLAVDIAQRVLELNGEPLLKPLRDIPLLSRLAQEMVDEVLLAYVRCDVEIAKKVILRDAQADELRDEVQQELIQEYIKKDGLCAPRAIPLLLVARHLERICDHATNIAEDVIFLVNAKIVRHRVREFEE